MHHIILTMLVLLRVIRTQTGELRDFRFGSCLVFFPGFMDFGLQLNWEPHLTKKKRRLLLVFRNLRTFYLHL